MYLGNMSFNVRTEYFQTHVISEIFLQATIGGCVPSRLINKLRKKKDTGFKKQRTKYREEITRITRRLLIDQHRTTVPLKGCQKVLGEIYLR